jgi:hypothetical protein
MPRTNGTLVKAILAPGKDYDERRNPSLDPFIEVASGMIDDLVTLCQNSGILPPPDARLKTLEGWVAAWAYKNSDQQMASSTARSSASFKGQTGMMLQSNHYGQTAITLDPTGILGSQNAKATVGGQWSGRPPSAQTPYRQRN